MVLERDELQTELRVMRAQLKKGDDARARNGPSSDDLTEELAKLNGQVATLTMRNELLESSGDSGASLNGVPKTVQEEMDKKDLLIDELRRLVEEETADDVEEIIASQADIIAELRHSLSVALRDAIDAGVETEQLHDDKEILQAQIMKLIGRNGGHPPRVQQQQQQPTGGGNHRAVRAGTIHSGGGGYARSASVRQPSSSGGGGGGRGGNRGGGGGGGSQGFGRTSSARAPAGRANFARSSSERRAPPLGRHTAPEYEVRVCAFRLTVPAYQSHQTELSLVPSSPIAGRLWPASSRKAPKVSAANPCPTL
jgi:hypothetical protein